ncbi:LysR family transcriptional regulator [Aestuariispira insulae]|uniref:LysR family transcriptional regulator n=1 Tax=Aestuariispira insulae TaxID=1461337 RepID=A0A3D9HX65_9PROT|nr:LysR family transcriptional regulator [Aestuariispira insulae]RED53971.1 LysR family transcriptional regulator [Aestuariispira insulae]
MNLSGIDLNLLLVFEAIYTERNLSKAGERLSLSQPAVSNALRRLRETLNNPLFVRTAEGMVPTNHAVAIQPTIAKALDDLRSCLTPDLSFDPAQAKNHFRISLSDIIGSLILPELIAKLQDNAPHVDLTFRHVDRKGAYEMLRTGRHDLVISTELDGPGMYQQLLFKDPYVTLVSNSHSTIRDDLTLKQFCQAKHILFSLEGQGPGLVDTALARQSLKRHVALRLPHVSVIPKIVEESDMIVTLPLRMARIHSEALNIKTFKPPVEVPDLAVYQYWHSRSHHDPACGWIRSQILETCRARVQ